MVGRIIVIADDEPLIAGPLARVIQGPNRRVIVCSDAESAAAVIENCAVSLLLTDVRMNSGFGHEGLELVRRASTVANAPQIAVMTGLCHPQIADEARARGAIAVLQKPFDFEDVESLVVRSPLVPIPPSMEMAPLVSHFPRLDGIIGGDGLLPVYQPIYDLTTDPITIHGFESLARYPAGAGFADIRTLLRYAELAGRVTNLDVHLLRNSFQHSRVVAGSFRMFVNVHPETLAVAGQLESIIRDAGAAGHSPESIVVEISEVAEIRDREVVCRMLKELHDQGVGLALDDVGSSVSHLWLFDRIPLDYVKIGPDFGSGFERDSARFRIIRNIQRLASDFGVPTVLEGIETAATLEATRELGISFGQGYHMSRPISAAALADLVDHAA